MIWSLGANQDITGGDFWPERRISRPGGIEVAYWTSGKGSPLLLIAGLGAPAAAWGPFPLLLEQQGYQVIVAENRDAGRSSLCEGIDYTIADMADDAVAILDDVGVEKAYVLGISMGGMIAQELALGHPSRVNRLMLISTSPGSSEGIPPSPEVVLELLSEMTLEEESESWMNRVAGLTGPSFIQADPELVQLMASAEVEPIHPAAYERQLQAILGFDSWDRLLSLQIPTMVVHGEADPLVPFANGLKLAGRIPRAELIALPGVGHLAPLEAPIEVLSAIFDFFPVATGTDVALGQD